MSKKHRLIVSKPGPKDLVAGSKRRLAGLPINPGGHWTPYLPPDDIQNAYMEPEACASYAILHCVQILQNKEFGDTGRYSQRFLAKESNTQPDGNDPHLVAETLRKKGVCNIDAWPYTPDINTWEKYYADIPVGIEALALGFLTRYDLGHQYEYTDPERMVQALYYSPLAVGVWAWDTPDKDGIYHRPKGAGDDHLVCLYDYEPGKWWCVFDSYDQTHKRLAWDFSFSLVKTFTLHKAVIDDSILGKLMKLLRAILALPNGMAFKLGLVGAQLPSPGQLAWGDPIAARHSARVVMDCFNLSWEQKGELCSTIMGESGFKNTAVCHNYKEVDTGKKDASGNPVFEKVLVSTDWGLIQCNDRIWIGPGKQFPSVDYLLGHPEEQIAWMVREYLAGNIDWWIAHKNGSYKKYMPDGLLVNK